MKGNITLRDVLQSFRKGEISLHEAESMIDGLSIEKVGNLARIDTGRSIRCGMPEVVLSEGKSPDQLLEILETFVNATGRCIATRVTPERAEKIQELCRKIGADFMYDENAHAAILSKKPRPPKHGGIVGIITAGTSDIGVAEEARIIAEEMGCKVKIAYDVGAAGIHRLFPALTELADAHVLIVAAGREGTLPAVVAGLVDRPVIGVPVSTGYGYMGKGEAALASMLQSCAVLTVVNIDAGFTAGAFAARIAEMVAEND